MPRAVQLLALLLFFAAPVFSQTQNGWALFERVEFSRKFFEDYGMSLPWPKFDEEIRRWEGRELMLSGYIIPTADAPGYSGLILSKFTYAQCFFCGKAGMASVAEVVMKKPMKDYRIDKPYVFKGRLQLNDQDPAHLVFLLLDAELMEL